MSKRGKTTLAIGAALLLSVGLVVAFGRYDLTPHKAALVAKLPLTAEQSLTIDGPMTASMGLSPTVSLFGVKARDPRASLSVERIEVHLALLPLLGGRVEVEKLELLRPQITLTAAPAAPAAPTEPVTAAPLTAAPLTTAPAKLASKTATGEANGSSHDKFRVRAVDITEGQVVLPGQTIALQHVTVRAGGDDEPVRLEMETTVQISSEAKPLALTLQGSVGPLGLLRAGSLDSRLDLHGTVLDGLVWAVSGTPSKTLEVSLGRSRLSLTLVVDSKATPMAITGTVAAAMLDIPELLGEAKTTKPEVAQPDKTQPDKTQPDMTQPDMTQPDMVTAPTARLFSAAPLPWESLKKTTAHLTLKADKVLLPNGLAVEALDTVVDLSKGVLVLKPLSLSMAGGRLSGAVVLDGPATKLAVELDGKAVLMGAVVSQVARRSLLAGLATDASLDVRGQGASLANLMAGLDGALVLKIGNGQVLADGVTALPASLASLLKGEKVLEIGCGVVNLKASHGMMKWTKAMAAETRLMTVTTSGSADLAHEQLDMVVEPLVKGLGLAGKLNVKGPLAHPALVGIEGLKLDSLKGGDLDSLLASNNVSPCALAMAGGGPIPSPTPTTPPTANPADPLSTRHPSRLPLSEYSKPEAILNKLLGK